jgi:hypothetical protein
LFHKLDEFPEWETKTTLEKWWNEAEFIGSTTLDSAWPLFNRNYFWIFSDKHMEKNGKKYFHIEPKEVITPW